MKKYLLVFFGGLVLGIASLFAGFAELFGYFTMASVLLPIAMFVFRRLPRWLDATSKTLANVSSFLKDLTVAKAIFYLICAPYAVIAIFAALFFAIMVIIPDYGMVAGVAGLVVLWAVVLPIPMVLLYLIMKPWLPDDFFGGEAKENGSPIEPSKEGQTKPSPKQDHTLSSLGRRSDPSKKTTKKTVVHPPETPQTKPLGAMGSESAPKPELITGLGSKKLPDGTVLSGNFMNDHLQGNGYARFPNGLVYEGGFVNSAPNGQGTGTYADGSVYKGVFLNGKMHGNGEIRWANGDHYKGMFRNDKITGYGVLTSPQGEVTEGLFEDGKLVPEAAKPVRPWVTDVETTVKLSLEEAYTGVNAKEVSAAVKVFTINHNKNRDLFAQSETRKLKLNIPAGIKDGQVVRLPNQGHRGPNGEASDLMIKVSVKEHPDFTRNGDDLYTVQELPPEIAAEGGYVEMHTIDGGLVRVNFAKNAVSGQKFRLRGKGMPKGDGQYGHLVVEYRVKGA